MYLLCLSLSNCCTEDISCRISDEKWFWLYPGKKRLMKKSRELIKAHFFKYKLLFGVLLLLIIAGIITDSVNPYLYGKIIDSVIQNDLHTLKKNLLLFFMVSVLVQILGILETTLGKIITIRIENSLKTVLYELVLAMNCREQEK